MLLRTYGWMPCWRIVFSTFLRCMNFYTASVNRCLVGQGRNPCLSAFVKVFGCRPMTDGTANTAVGGRRSKTSKGGNRGKGYGGGAARSMAIWLLRVG